MQHSMLGHGNVVSGEKMSQDCKPDYEKLIKLQKVRLDKILIFQNALLDYCDYDHVEITGNLAQLLGELVHRRRQCERGIDQMIAEQERQEKT